MNLEFAKSLWWGTYGPNAAEDHALFGTPLPKCVMKRLGDLDDDHLKRILFGQRQIDRVYRDALTLILGDRRREPLESEKQRLKIRRREAIDATKARKS